MTVLKWRKPAADLASGLSKGDQLPGVIDTENRAARADDQARFCRLPVFDDAVLIGWLLESRHPGVTAITLAGVSLGRFNTHRAGALAIAMAKRGVA